MQFTYALLDFKDLHTSKKVKKLINKNNYKVAINKDFEKVMLKIDSYHKDSWLKKRYRDMLAKILTEKHDNFQLFSFELYDKEHLVCAEIGYIIGKTYTSLTGFTSKEKIYNNWGTLQLVLLGKYLENRDFDFWNLGHSCLQYKLDLGAKIYKRSDFITRWKEST